MELNNDDGGGLASYYQFHNHQQQTPPPPQNAVVSSPANGGGVPNSTTNNSATAVYPHSVPVSAPMESVKRKRGRPRKYGTPEQAAAAKRMSTAPPRKREVAAAAAVSGVGSGSSVSSYSSKKSQLAGFGGVGQSFSPHIITVAGGEDVGQKIMMFMQQSKREICIISASGSVSNASLRQPATSGGSVTYEGRFDILSLSGSYIRTEHGGRTGGLSVCLSSSDGRVIGGGVGGPLTAASPIQVIVGTFLIDVKKDTKGDAAPGKLPSPISGGSAPGLSFRSPVDSPHQTGIGNPFLVQHQSMQMNSPHSMEWRGTGHGMHQSPENGDFDHITD